jgi:hypothetical protein
VWNVGTCRLDAQGAPRVVAPPAAEDRGEAQGRHTPSECSSLCHGGGAKGVERAACVLGNPRWEAPGQPAKPFSISTRMVWEAYTRVQATQGAAGVDAESLADGEANRTDTLYQLWNRLASGRYVPPPVRTVMIPKRDGGQRALGMPTVSDRMAQTVVAMVLEPVLEPYVHPDS